MNRLEITGKYELGRLNGVTFLLLGSQNLGAAHVGLQDLGDQNGAVLLQVVLQECDQHAGRSHAGVVQGVAQLDLAAATAAENARDEDVARQFRHTANRGRDVTGKPYMDAFDSMADALDRSLRRTYLIPKWDELTAHIRENF